MRNPLRRLAAALGALALAGAFCVSGEARAVQPPLKILAIGDSRSANGAWQTELGALLADAGVAADITTAAVPGTRCGYWTDRIYPLLADAQPDLVVIACGTNDDPNQQRYGEPETGWAIRYLIEAVHAYKPSAKVLPALAQYSDPLVAFPWLLGNEPRTNDTLWVNINRYASTGWLAGVADFQKIPATADYLLDERSAQYPIGLGIHPTAKGSQAMGRIVYDSAAATMGWPAIGEPLCGMYGHRKGYPRPAYTPCSWTGG